MDMLSAAIVVNSLDMVLSFSRAMDLLHPAISEHHLRVAYASACIAEEMGFAAAEVQSILVAGALHDVAAACAPAARPVLDRALASDPFDKGGLNVHDHGEDCHRLFSRFEPFAGAARAIRFHHVDWNHGEGKTFRGHAVPLESHILRLADRVAVLPPEGSPAVTHADASIRTIRARSGERFHPDVVDAFVQAACRESFWLDLVSKHKESILRERFGGGAVILNGDRLHGLAKVFASIVDYRSAYTAAHSSAVASTSELLAARIGLARPTVRLVGVAGYLHDLGKLAVPPAMLEKPGRLTREETVLIRQHPYYTYQILSAVPGLEDVCTWAALHHERLDGAGYPFRRRSIPLEARIVAVADVFTAITEDRPYRQGMSRAESLRVLDDLVRQGAIDGDIVSLINGAYEDLTEVRAQALHVA
ncbi:MAG TPA: HD domain-containing phosphohydrolase [Noviherbaspirillum sp.]|uniref:HD-GYP domain-containing protein n=1 Tax=Noviherbaspirillum sp. TaxID=1926288 RepID=UPI002D48009E|nr:HD domain-containing phosphohydrolase [Noviherbaspirillum sp.]HYD93878.1 HD domain-containing phosphohydrolase [Noviherbaspirillum sp.]